MKKYIIIIILILVILIFKKNNKKKEHFVVFDKYNNISTLDNRLKNLTYYNDTPIEKINLKIKVNEIIDESGNFEKNYTKAHETFIKELNDKKKLLYDEIVPKLILNKNILNDIIKADLYNNKSAETGLDAKFKTYKTAYNKSFTCKVEKFTSQLNCGGHRADSCSKCPFYNDEYKGKGYCNGDCYWDEKKASSSAEQDKTQPGCLLKKRNCGSHRTNSCSKCPFYNNEYKGKGYCNGDCYWDEIKASSSAEQDKTQPGCLLKIPQSKLSEIEYIKNFIKNKLDNNQFYKIKDNFKVIDLINKDVDIADDAMYNLSTTDEFDCKTLSAGTKLDKFTYYNQFKCLSKAFETYYDKTLKLKQEINDFVTKGLALVDAKAKPVTMAVGIMRNTKVHSERPVHGATVRRANKPVLTRSPAPMLAPEEPVPLRVAKFSNTEKFSNETENIPLKNLDLLSKELTKNNSIYIPKLKVGKTNIISDSTGSKIKNINANINLLNSVLGTYSVSADNLKPRTLIAKKNTTETIIRDVTIGGKKVKQTLISRGLKDLVDEIGEYIHCNYEDIKKAIKVQGATVKALEDHIKQLAEYDQAQNQYNSQMYYGNYR